MAQARAHADDLELHLLGAESDLGGGRVYGLEHARMKARSRC
jgi:hypothetical protein